MLTLSKRLRRPGIETSNKIYKQKIQELKEEEVKLKEEQLKVDLAKKNFDQKMALQKGTTYVKRAARFDYFWVGI